MEPSARTRSDAGFTLPEACLIACILLALSFLFYSALTNTGPREGKAGDAQNNRQIALAGIMYGGDFDDRIPLLINGRWDRLQNRGDNQLTINCPGPGTQDFPSPDAAGAQRTDTWVTLTLPYIRSLGLFVCPHREDEFHYFRSEARAVNDPGYDPGGPTYRNQGRFPFYGLNYMFLSPIRIPKSKLNKPNAVNYAEGLSHSFNEADDPAGTVFFVSSQQSMNEPNRGFFVVNAPGMWNAFADNTKGYVAFWGGGRGGGDWSGTHTACADTLESCSPGSNWAGFAWAGLNDGTNASFLDGHVKYFKMASLATGTDYASARAGSQGSLGSGARIVNRKAYLWDLRSRGPDL